MLFAPALHGFFMGLSLIVVIGAQNAFVLRTGLERRHVLPVALFCATSDAVLIFAGVAGFGAIVQRNEQILQIAVWLGMALLLYYACQAFYRAYLYQGGLSAGGTATGLWAKIGTLIAITWLNPHVYLDTVVLLGAIAQTTAAPWIFGAGAAVASFTFFFALGFGAQWVAPRVKSPRVWQVIDLAIGGILLMATWSLWTIAQHGLSVEPLG
jgi:L-lysine exporter family protein LysE/ArgO